MVNKWLFRMIKWILKQKFMQMCFGKAGNLIQMDDPYFYRIKVKEYFIHYFKDFRPSSHDAEKFEQNFINFIANMINPNLAKKSSQAMRVSEVRRSLKCIEACSWNFTKSKMASALWTKCAAVLFLSFYDLGWFEEYLRNENINTDLMDHILEKAWEISEECWAWHMTLEL